MHHRETPIRIGSAAPVAKPDGDDDKPLFLFPGMCGEAGEVGALAERVGALRTVVVLETCRSNETGALVSTIPEMAACGLAAMRRIQPRGPYHLTGYSFGGLVAFEIAQRLKLAGEDVALLGLIDTLYDQRYWPAPTWMRSQALRIVGHIRHLRTLPLRSALPLLKFRAVRLFGRLADRLGVSKVESKAQARPLSATDACRAAMECYRPEFYPGVITLIHSEKEHEFHGDLSRLWRDYATVIDARTIAGRHLALVREAESLDQLADQIGRCLDALSTPQPRLAEVTPAAGAAPRVLIATSLRWLSTVRVARAFSEAGFAVEALCPPGHALGKVDFVARAHRFSALSPLRSLRGAIDACAPDLVVPCDDRVAGQLRQLHADLRADDLASHALRELITRSLGGPEYFPILSSRTHLIALSRAEGVRCPETDVIADPDALRVWLDRFGYPAVLKTDGSWGGEGVAVVRDFAEATRAYHRLAAPPRLSRVIKRRLTEGGANLLRPWLRRDRPTVSIQRYVHGRPANAAVAGWRGEVLAATTVEVLQTAGATGHATVVRTIDHPEMLQAVTRVVGRLKLSGLCGLDFILNEAGDEAQLIEINPRATPTCHLSTHDGRDLIALLGARLTGRPRPKDGPARHNEIVALFPAELTRDPDSPFMRSARHDVPRRSPQFVRLGFAPTGGPRQRP
jgi:thioesterase domain-containing protein